MAPSIEPSEWTYKDYVCFLRSHGFHNLGLLDEYLEWGVEARNTPSVKQPEFSRTMLLEFTKNTTRISDLSDINKLRVLLREWTRSASPSSPGPVGPSGRVIIVENPAPALVDTLGGLLNIEPTFFANHLDDKTMSHTSDSSSSIPLASATARTQRDHFTLDYFSTFIPLNCPKDVDGLSLQCAGNYPRRIELIQKQGRQKVAIARRKISFYLRQPKSSGSEPWLSVILVDPPISKFTASFTSFSTPDIPSQELAILPYQGGYLDFIEMRKPHNRQAHDFRDCRHRASSPAPFDDLIRHFQIQCRDGLFLSTPPNLPTYMRPALQLAAAETSTFLSYISSQLSTPLPSQSASPHILRRTLDRLLPIDALLSTSKPRLTLTKDFLTHLSAPSDLQFDHRALLSTLHHHRATIDTHLAQLTTLLQTHETTSLALLGATGARRSEYLRLLVVLSLIYLPFAVGYVLFSLPHDFAPAKGYLGAWTGVTVGVVAVVVLVALPEARDGVLGFLGSGVGSCGGLSRGELLRGEKFRRRREGGGDADGERAVREWVNSSGSGRHEPGRGPALVGGLTGARPESQGTWGSSVRTKAWDEV